MTRLSLLFVSSSIVYTYATTANKNSISIRCYAISYLFDLTLKGFCTTTTSIRLQFFHLADRCTIHKLGTQNTPAIQIIMPLVWYH